MKKLFIIGIAALLVYLPIFFNYFSHDDFFSLKISRADTVSDVVRFFDPFHAPSGFGSYRPITTQTYFLISRVFNYSTFPLHAISMSVFLVTIYQVFSLGMLLTKKQPISLMAAFLYAFSATHFVQLYWMSIFQELGLVLFYLAAIIFFVRRRYFMSLVAFCAALASKESAVTLPIVLGLLAVGFLKINFRRLVLLLTPFLLILFAYLYTHFFYYGLATGDSYVWDFSVKTMVNTLMWYGLWTFNAAEMLVDFIGPGLRVNPNLWRYYLWYVVPIIIILGTFAFIMIPAIIKKRWDPRQILSLSGWYLISLSPVVFLPWHKFPYELGVPIVGFSILTAILLNSLSPRVRTVFVCLWLVSFCLTSVLTYRTHWVVSGAKSAQLVDKYLAAGNRDNLVGKTLVFYDTPWDNDLPWRPSGQIKLNLSDQDYFVVFHPEIKKVIYLTSEPDSDQKIVKLPARQFLSY